MATRRTIPAVWIATKLFKKYGNDDNEIATNIVSEINEIAKLVRNYFFFQIIILFFDLCLQLAEVYVYFAARKLSTIQGRTASTISESESKRA